MRDRDTDPSLTLRQGLAVRVDLRLDRDPGLRPVDLVLAAEPVDMVVLHRVVLHRVVLRPADLRRVSPADPHLARLAAGPLDLLLMRPAGLVVLRRLVLDLTGRLDLADPHLADRVVLDLISLADPVGRGNLAVPELISLVDPVVRALLAGPVVQVDLGDRVGLGLMDLVAPAVLVGLGLMDPLDPVVRVVLVDPRRRRIGPEVSTIAVVPSLVALATRRTASAHPTMGRRLHPRSTGSAGTTDLPPEVLHPTGTVRRLPVAGTVRRLLVAGTGHGTGRRVRLLWRRPILGRSITVASTPSRSSTRSSADGASGSSARGFRCTDLTALEGVAPWFAMRLRRDAARSEKNACGVILVQDVRRGYVPRQSAGRHQSHRTSVGRSARSLYLPTRSDHGERPDQASNSDRRRRDAGTAP